MLLQDEFTSVEGLSMLTDSVTHATLKAKEESSNVFTKLFKNKNKIEAANIKPERLFTISYSFINQFVSLTLYYCVCINYCMYK